MLLVGIDVETTGLDTSKDRIIELAYAVWCTEKGAPLFMRSSLVQTDASVSEEITKITGITPDMLGQFGESLKATLTDFVLTLAKHRIEYLVAYNGRNFDYPVLNAELKRVEIDLPEVKCIDPVEDLPYEEVAKRRKLVHMAADHGFLNPFPHRALFDVLTMMKILQGFPLPEVLHRAASPSVVVRAMLPYEDVSGREAIKKKGFRFNELDGKRYEKQWVKKIKECDLPFLQKEVPVKLVIIARG